MLKKTLRLRTLVAASAGLGLASSVYPVAVQTAAATGGRTVWLAILAAGAVCLLSARNFASLAERYPTAGGVQVYVRHAFGNTLSTTVTLLYIILAMAAGAAEAYIFVSVLVQLFKSFHLVALASLPLPLWSAIVLTVFYTINFLGVEIAGRAQEILTYSMLILLAGFSIYALGIHTGSPPAAATAPATLAPVGLGQAIAYAIYMYIGFEWITPLAEETCDKMFLGRAMSLAIVLLAAIYTLFTLGLVRHLPLNATLLNSTTPHLVFARAVAGRTGLLLMGLISVIATLTAFNAGIMGNSRLIYAMAREGMLPRFMSKIHLRFFTPWSALLTAFVLQLAITLAVVTTGTFKVPILLAATIECIIYTLVSLSVIKLKIRQTDRKSVV